MNITMDWSSTLSGSSCFCRSVADPDTKYAGKWFGPVRSTLRLPSATNWSPRRGGYGFDRAATSSGWSTHSAADTQRAKRPRVATSTRLPRHQGNDDVLLGFEIIEPRVWRDSRFLRDITRRRLLGFFRRQESEERWRVGTWGPIQFLEAACASERSSLVKRRTYNYFT